MSKMLDYEILPMDKKLARDIIIKNHYTHKWSSCRYALGLFLDDRVYGVAIYGFPVGRQVVKSITPSLENTEVLELTRLWLKDEAPKNSESFFIGKTFKWLKKNTDIKVLISYADPMADHVGIIYQATNWLYQGNNTMLVKGYLHKINGEVLHPRSVVAKYGTTKATTLVNIDPNYERIELKKKHRYIYILSKTDKRNIIENLKHPILPYPKNNDNCEWVNKNNLRSDE
tara:strand:+ start:6115 stop:6801 length:687 start_codon:yes stop_codon:yes gene_type:complete